MYSYSYVREFLFLVTAALLIALALISVTRYVRKVKQRKIGAQNNGEIGKTDTDNVPQ